MPLCRYAAESRSSSKLGFVDRESKTVTEVQSNASSLDEALSTHMDWKVLQKDAGTTTHGIDDIELLAPVDSPTNLIGVGLNYAGHAEEGGYDVPEEPVFFAKSPSSIADPGASIKRHEGVTNLHYEGEFAFVIGTQASNVSERKAMDHVFGYMAANDVTARDIQLDDLDASNPWYRSKSMNTFTPLGPWVVPADNIDPRNTGVETRLNGDVVQSSNTDDHVFDVASIVSYISSFVTLQPGDVVLTGTPAGVGEMTPGDTVSVDVEGVGSLTNQVVEP